MKKCPECGNPSYDGAPVCGNCGYKFPKAKNITQKREDIFKQAPEIEKTSNNEDTVSIIKKNKLVIGIILVITLIVICGIVFMGSNNNKSNDSNPIIQTSDLLEYGASDFAFKYPKTWKKINLTDEEHPGAIFFETENNSTVEYYNITTDAQSLKDINQQRISLAQENGDFVELLETVTLDGRNSSNMILENADGDYTRYVSMFSDGQLYVFKITGGSENSVTSEAIESTISSADIA